MSHPFWQTQLVHVTPEHGGSPSVRPLPPSLGGPAHPRQGPLLRPEVPPCALALRRRRESPSESPQIDSSPMLRACSELAGPRRRGEPKQHGSHDQRITFRDTLASSPACPARVGPRSTCRSETAQVPSWTPPGRASSRSTVSPSCSVVAPPHCCHDPRLAAMLNSWVRPSAKTNVPLISLTACHYSQCGSEQACIGYVARHGWSNRRGQGVSPSAPG